MRKGIFGDITEKQLGYLNKMVGSGEHLLSLINDILDITKIQSDMLKLYLEEHVDVAHELGVVAASVEKMLRNRPVKLILDVDADLPHLTCDRRRVRQIFYNLMFNAVKFTEEGTITVSAKKRDDGLLFAVIDTGPGIASESQTIIFDPFVQTEAGIKHAGGTGLGLPISRQLAEAHGGKLWLESEPGDGASFFVSLPLVAQEKVGVTQETIQ